VRARQHRHPRRPSNTLLPARSPRQHRFANGLADSCGSLVDQTTHRGYTEHEHLDEVGVIHMNGRIYDPLVGLKLVKAIDDLAKPCDFASPIDDSFDLNELLATCKLEASDDVYINWYRYDKIDQLKKSDLARFFTDIWYEGSDDLDIFDGTFNWMLLIRHDGYLKLLRS
jgi:hypothetical protein